MEKIVNAIFAFAGLMLGAHALGDVIATSFTGDPTVMLHAIATGVVALVSLYAGIAK